MKLTDAEAAPEFDIADELAALNAFRSLEQLAPEFWQANFQRAMYVRTVASGLAGESDELQAVLGIAVFSPKCIEGDLVRHELNAIEWEPERVHWFQNQLTLGLRAAHALTREPGFPEWLVEAKRIVNAGFIVPE